MIDLGTCPNILCNLAGHDLEKISTRPSFCHIGAFNIWFQFRSTPVRWNRLPIGYLRPIQKDAITFFSSLRMKKYGLKWLLNSFNNSKKKLNFEGVNFLKFLT